MLVKEKPNWVLMRSVMMVVASLSSLLYLNITSEKIASLKNLLLGLIKLLDTIDGVDEKAMAMTDVQVLEKELAEAQNNVVALFAKKSLNEDTDGEESEAES